MMKLYVQYFLLSWITKIFQLSNAVISLDKWVGENKPITTSLYKVQVLLESW